MTKTNIKVGKTSQTEFFSIQLFVCNIFIFLYYYIIIDNYRTQIFSYLWDVEFCCGAILSVRQSFDKCGKNFTAASASSD